MTVAALLVVLLLPQKKIGPYQFFEKERWDRFNKKVLPNIPGRYLVIRTAPAVINTKGKFSQPCEEIIILKNNLRTVTPVPLSHEWIKLCNPILQDYDSVLFIDAPVSLKRDTSIKNSRQFFSIVLKHFYIEWLRK